MVVMNLPVTRRILSIQSHVAYGHVGNAAAAFALQRIGFEVISVPTVIYSNHPGHKTYGGRSLTAYELSELLDGLYQNGWFGKIDGIITGYLGNAEQAAIIATHIAALKEANTAMLYCCDPVCGDQDSGLYVSRDIPKAIVKDLIPLADVITPNWYELGELAHTTLTHHADAENAARSLTNKTTICTSTPVSEEQIGTLLINQHTSHLEATPKLPHVPHGAGDLFTALYLGHYLRIGKNRNALARTVASLHEILKASSDKSRRELDLVESQALLEN